VKRRAVTLIARIGVGLVGLACASGAAAQSFNQELARYRAAKSDCARLYQDRVGQGCDEACRKAAAERQAACLSKAEERYGAAIRRALRPTR